jgi:hypothetical protein
MKSIEVLFIIMLILLILFWCIKSAIQYYIMDHISINKIHPVSEIIVSDKTIVHTKTQATVIQIT